MVEESEVETGIVGGLNSSVGGPHTGGHEPAQNPASPGHESLPPDSYSSTSDALGKV